MKFKVLSVENDLVCSVSSNFSNRDEYFDSCERYSRCCVDDRFLRKIDLEPGDELDLFDIIKALNKFSCCDIN